MKVKPPKGNPDQTHGFEVICSTATPKITALKCNDSEPPSISLACCENLLRSCETQDIQTRQLKIKIAMLLTMSGARWASTMENV